MHQRRSVAGSFNGHGRTWLAVSAMRECECLCVCVIGCFAF